MYFKTEGIILSQKNLGEADKLLTIFTKTNGKISCIAKGARRPLSKKSGHIELGNWCKIFVVRGKNLDLITEIEVKKAFGNEDITPEKANKIYHLLEVVDYITPINQNNPQIFLLLLNFLQTSSEENDFNLFSAIFKIKLLSLLGYFSAVNLKSSKTKNLLEKIEKSEVRILKDEVRFDEKDYLNLLAFLDSIIENLTERKLKTKKFIYGQI